VKKKVKPLKPKQEIPKSIPEVLTEKENPLDFGGLPQRDLKKNLGCG
jgi:hypothetical protein